MMNLAIEIIINHEGNKGINDIHVVIIKQYIKISSSIYYIS